MAARTRSGTKHAPWDERVRERIQSGMLVNNLQEFINSCPPSEYDGNRLKAIEILLNKTLPNLASVESFNQTEVSVISAEPMSPEAWAETHGAQDGETRQ